MMTRAVPLLTGALCLSLAVPAAATQYVYPAHGQSPAKQQKDEYACHNWAVKQSGFDPAHPPTVVAATPAPVTGSGARVKGAAVGAAVGSFSGNAGQGAAIGAVTGGVIRRNRNRQEAAAQSNALAQQIAAGQAAYGNARAACLTGKGYTVK
jgi:outer membrane protein with glycine zipper